MGGVNNIRAIQDARDAGRFHSGHFRKVPSQASTAGWWVDLSMASGNPVPQYYAASPLIASTLEGHKGLFHGFSQSPYQKFITELMLCTSTAGLVGEYRLLDYLLYYPFIDLDTTDTQVLDNTTTLPRYVDGAGVMAMFVAAAPTVGGGQFTFDYINQDDVLKTSPTNFCHTSAQSASIASILTYHPATAGVMNGPFLRLASGDTGIRRIESITMLNVNGGLGALVLIKPLLNATIREINTPSEKSFISEFPGMPKVEDGAYLHLIMQCAATVAAGLLTGRINVIWN